ncbi:MAG: prepilin-type N-terminal cleavage/methylation domain-containing protein [Candidatus Margulisiibacteriota bacterium]|jgi:prepilin-type N-terminal cleavage/methylation domain-containing protein
MCKIPRSKGVRGFTMIELVVVVVVLAILAAVGLSRMPVQSRMKLTSCRDRMMRDIRFAQTSAVTQQDNYGVIFDVALDTYSVYQGAGNYANVITNPATGTPYDVDLTASFTGIDLLSTDLAGTFVEFDGQGVPHESGAELASQKNIILKDSALGDTATISITQMTGMVKYQ